MKKVRTGLLAALTVVGLVGGALGTPAGAAKTTSSPLKGEGEGLEIVANIQYSGGTDMEFATIKGKDYAFAANAPTVGAATEENAGLRVIDITNPAKPKLVAFLNCALYQGDVQLSHDKKYAYLAADRAGGPGACLGVGKLGFLVIDIRNPAKPKAVSFAEIPRGSHNVTAHPTKPYVYNSNSDLAGGPEIEIWKLSNPKKPEKVNTIRSIPHAPHDISFNKKGTMAVTAAISHWDLLDTSDPENPTLAFSNQCPGCSITHDAKFTPDGKGLLIGDEGGGGGGYPCPGGALYFYQLQGDRAPILTGIYEPDEVVFARQGQSGPQGCTSHVMEISKDGKTVAISWYSAGTRYLDISAMSGAAFGGRNTGGIKQLGWFQPEGGNTWSSKFLNSSGKYIFSNDINRGFDVFKITK